MNKGTSYSGDDKVIAAHEYGHLLGIPDEYSQSNEQLNALIHQAAPSSAPSARAALDRASVERMVLSSMMLPLLRQLDLAMPTVTDALRAERPLLKQKMTAAARDGVVSADVVEALRGQLAAASEARLSPGIPAIVAFETAKNFNRAQAGTGVEAGFSASALARQIRDTYWQALRAADANRVVTVAGLGAVSINPAASVGATTAAGGVNAAAAAAEATAAIRAGGRRAGLAGGRSRGEPRGQALGPAGNLGRGRIRARDGRHAHPLRRQDAGDPQERGRGRGGAPAARRRAAAQARQPAGALPAGLRDGLQRCRRRVPAACRRPGLDDDEAGPPAGRDRPPGIDQGRGQPADGDSAVRRRRTRPGGPDDGCDGCRDEEDPRRRQGRDEGDRPRSARLRRRRPEPGRDLQLPGHDGLERQPGAARPTSSSPWSTSSTRS